MPSQHVADRGFVRRIGIGMQKADRDRLDPERRQPPPQHFDGGGIERDEHLARGIHALGHLEGQLARHQRPRPMEEQIEGIGRLPRPMA